MVKKLNESYDKPYMIADEKGSVYTFSLTKLEKISDLASKEVLNRVEKYLAKNNNKGSADSTLYDLLSDAKASLAKVNEYVKRYDKTNNESKSRTRRRSIKEDMEDKKYKAYAYLDLHRRNGLMDSIETDDFEELRDWCWEKIHDGVWLSVDNDDTGSYACLELPEDAEYLDYYDLDDCIIRKDSSKEIVSFNDLY